MIKNKASLGRKNGDAVCILEAGLLATQPGQFLKKFIKKDRLKMGRKTLNTSRFDQIHIVAVGKAAGKMADSVCEKIRVSGGLVILPEGQNVRLPKKLTVIKSSHPIPSEKSVRAAKAMLRLLNSTKTNDLVLFLISGGASALVSLPSLISLRQKQKLTKVLLRCGASIDEINALRKHFSSIKGGRLLEGLKCHAVSYVMSDVVGDDLSVIGSGLTFYDRTTFSDCLEILKKYHLFDKLPKKLSDYLRLGARGRIAETPKRAKIPNVVVATNSDCLKAMRKKAKSLGYEVKVLPQLGANVSVAARKILNEYNRGKKSCLLFGGETTVVVRGSGMGGRNQELVLQIALRVSEPLVVASVGTDGIDGNTKFAGAVFAAPFDKSIIRKYLDNNDSSSFFKRYGGAVLTGPTNSNLMDIGLVLTP